MVHHDQNDPAPTPLAKEEETTVAKEIPTSSNRPSSDDQFKSIPNPDHEEEIKLDKGKDDDDELELTFQTSHLSSTSKMEDYEYGDDDEDDHGEVNDDDVLLVETRSPTEPRQNSVQRRHSNETVTLSEQLNKVLFTFCCCCFPVGFVPGAISRNDSNRRNQQQQQSYHDATLTSTATAKEKEYRIRTGSGRYEQVKLDDPADLEEEDFTDTYAFLFTSRFDTHPHGCWLAVLLWTVQVLIYFMVFFNSVTLNPFDFGFPAGVDGWTRVAQFLAILITALTQPDFRTAIFLTCTSYMVVHKEETEQEVDEDGNFLFAEGDIDIEEQPNSSRHRIGQEFFLEKQVSTRSILKKPTVSSTAQLKPVGIDEEEVSGGDDEGSIDLIAFSSNHRDNVAYQSDGTIFHSNAVKGEEGDKGSQCKPTANAMTTDQLERFNQSVVTFEDTGDATFRIEDWERMRDQEREKEHSQLGTRRSTGVFSRGACTARTKKTVVTLDTLGCYHGKENNQMERALSIVGRFVSGALGVFGLDDAAYWLAKNGLLGKGFKKEANRVRELIKVKRATIMPTEENEYKKYDIRKPWFPWQQWIIKRQRVFLLFFVTALLTIGWGVIYKNQVDGDYTEQHIFVQMSDTVNPDLSSLSGLYEYRTYCRDSDNKRRCAIDRKKNDIGPVVYENTFEDISGTKHRSFFAYCEKLESWTFTYERDDIVDPDPCTDYAVRSETGGSSTAADMFDILSHSSATWVVREFESNGLELQMERFVIFHVDDDKASCHDDRKKVSLHDCEDGYGPRFKHVRETCDVLTISGNTTTGIKPENQEFQTTFFRQLFVNTSYGSGRIPVSVSYRPVFYYQLRQFTRTQLIFYNGRRFVSVWNDTISDCNKDYVTCETTEQLALYIQKKFHPKWSAYDVEYTSDPIDIGSVSDKAYPHDDMIWYRTKEDKNGRWKVTGDGVSTRWNCCTGDDCDEIVKFDRDRESVCDGRGGVPILVTINPDDDSTLEISFDYYEVGPDSDGLKSPLDSGGSGIFNKCIPSGRCGVIKSENSGSLTINEDGVEVVSRSEFAFCSVHVVGPDCDETKLRNNGSFPECKRRCSLCPDGNPPGTPEKLKDDSMTCRDFDVEVVRAFDLNSTECTAYQNSYGRLCNCADVWTNSSFCPNGYVVDQAYDEELKCAEQQLLYWNESDRNTTDQDRCCSTPEMNQTKPFTDSIASSTTKNQP